jgi:hypothetical protein
MLKKSLLIVLLSCVSIISWAHRGGTDKCGCHTNKNTGEYHCHTKKYGSGCWESEKKANKKSVSSKKTMD